MKSFLSPKPSFFLINLAGEIISKCYADLSATDLVASDNVLHRVHQLIAYDAVCSRRCVQTRWNSFSSNSAILLIESRRYGTWKQL